MLVRVDHSPRMHKAPLHSPSGVDHHESSCIKCHLCGACQPRAFTCRTVFLVRFGTLQAKHADSFAPISVRQGASHVSHSRFSRTGKDPPTETPGAPPPSAIRRCHRRPSCSADETELGEVEARELPSMVPLLRPQRADPERREHVASSTCVFFKFKRDGWMRTPVPPFSSRALATASLLPANSRVLRSGRAPRRPG